MTTDQWNALVTGTKGMTVRPRAGSKLDVQGVRGKTTGSTRMCRLDGCTGVRIGVRWSNGRLTWPCSKGLLYHGRVAQIG